MDVQHLLLLIITYALVDSVDPCFFAIYASVLISIGLTNPREVVKSGLLFISAVGLGYFILGYALRSLALYFDVSRSAAAPYIILYGLLVTFYGVFKVMRRSGLGTDQLCREDNGALCKIARKLELSRVGSLSIPLRHAYLIALGLIISFTILPCSAGLYVVYNILLVNAPLYLWVFSTLLYILVFVSPLVVITFSLVGLVKITKYAASWGRIEKYSELIRVVGGIVAIITGVYLLLFEV